MNKLVLSIVVVFMAIVAKAQVVNIPDANFKAALLVNTEINTNNDNEIQESEAVFYKGVINVVGIGALNLTGIESFTNLSVLNCSYNLLTKLDVSKNRVLVKLNCHHNQLDSLDVSQNTTLAFLECSNNKITVLDLSLNIILSCLSLNNNQLTSLDLTKNILLDTLSLLSNKLTKLD